MGKWVVSGIKVISFLLQTNVGKQAEFYDSLRDGNLPHSKDGWCPTMLSYICTNVGLAAGESRDNRKGVNKYRLTHSWP